MADRALAYFVQLLTGMPREVVGIRADSQDLEIDEFELGVERGALGMQALHTQAAAAIQTRAATGMMRW